MLPLLDYNGVFKPWLCLDNAWVAPLFRQYNIPSTQLQTARTELEYIILCDLVNLMLGILIPGLFFSFVHISHAVRLFRTEPEYSFESKANVLAAVKKNAEPWSSDQTFGRMVSDLWYNYIQVGHTMHAASWSITNLIVFEELQHEHEHEHG